MCLSTLLLIAWRWASLGLWKSFPLHLFYISMHGCMCMCKNIYLRMSICGCVLNLHIFRYRYRYRLHVYLRVSVFVCFLTGNCLTLLCFLFLSFSLFIYLYAFKFSFQSRLYSVLCHLFCILQLIVSTFLSLSPTPSLRVFMRQCSFHLLHPSLLPHRPHPL